MPFGGITLRAELRPGDLGTIVHHHGAVYALEHGFDRTFDAYVAGPLSACVLEGSPRERIWIAESKADGRFLGCVAIVAAAERPGAAQLRWFLVLPEARGRGLGTRLLREAVAFARTSGYESLLLWTVSALAAAARRYEAEGFRKAESRPGRHWGVDVVEERYELPLKPPKT